MRYPTAIRSGCAGLAAAIAAATGAPAFCTNARLPAGTHVTLQLSHHITSSETPAGTPVYFRVRDDVAVGDVVVIRKGALVVGRMEATTERAAIAASGSLNFAVRFVPAVDGQNIRVIANMSRSGRSRDGALIGWTIFWGLPGLITRGASAYALRGAELDAEVLSDKVITVAQDNANPVETATPDTSQFEIAGHSYAGAKSHPLRIDLERAHNLPPLSFALAAGTAANSESGTSLKSAQLTAINGQAPGDILLASSIVERSFSFDSWSIVKYCDSGSNELLFQLTQQDGKIAYAHYALPVDFPRKDSK